MNERLFYPATERNREPILSVLKEHLPENGQVMEIASGSGEHMMHFARSFPQIEWVPSDPDVQCRQSIAAWTEHLALKNVVVPLALDATNEENWPQGPFDALVCINMVHISPWSATLGLMEKAARLIKSGGILFLYGPYKRDGQHTAESNVAFDGWLKTQNPAYGVRDMADVAEVAAVNGLCLAHVVDMPANNFSLVFQRA